MTEVLNLELLDRWAEAVEAKGRPLADVLGPGLSESQLLGLETQLGHSIPSELRTLWSWRVPTVTAAPLGLNAQLLRPAAVVEETITLRAILDDDDEPGWPHNGVLWASGDPYWLVAAGVTSERPVFLGDVGEPPRPIAPSIADVVAHWISVLDAGYEYYENGHWEQQDVAYFTLPGVRG